MADHDIFREQLAIKYPSYGYALWEPSPTNPGRPVQVGDVGFIRDGRFYRLFSALLPADDPSQEYGVPEHYKPLVPTLSDHVATVFFGPSNYCSAGVKVEADPGYHSSPDDLPQVVFHNETTRAAAVSSLPVTTRRDNTLIRNVFGQWMVKHIDTWLAFARNLGLVHQMEEIILVTGCDLTRSWTNIAFLGGRADAQVSFGVEVRGSVTGTTSNLDINYQFSPGLVRGAVLHHGPEGTNLPENQCAFIRGFRVVPSLFFLPKRLKAAAGPSPDLGRYNCEPDREVISMPAITQFRDPLYLLSDYIAEQTSDCDKVLVHDDDLLMIDGIGYGTTLESLEPDVMMDLIRKSNIKIHKFECDSFLNESQSGSNIDTANLEVATLSVTSQNYNPTSPSQLPPLAAQKADLTHASELRETPQPTIPGEVPDIHMFATLSSLLPSELQQGSHNPASTPNKDPSLAKVEDAKPKYTVVDEGSIKKEKRTKHESFIVVRPPATRSTHPLDMQIQLVPPKSRERERTRSLGVSQPSQDQEDTIFSRTSWNRSDVSIYSGSTLVAPFSSATSTSTASTASSRRMIVPLYNLKAYNVMTNTIVDAGTDAKVAKFLRRSLEIVGVAILEPFEVFGSYDISPQIPPSSKRTSIDGHQDPAIAQLIFTPQPGGAEGVHTPASSVYSLLSSEDHPSLSPPDSMRPVMDVIPTSGTKNIFGKLFKKKDNLSSFPSSSTIPSPIGNFIIRPSREDSEQSVNVIPPKITTHLQPPILGIRPSCSSPEYPPQGSPHSYTWVVRKWIKKGGHMNQLSLSDDRRQSRTPAEGVTEVYFVWSRGKKRKGLRDGNQTVGSNRRDTMVGSDGGLPDKRGLVFPPSRSATADRAEKRLSVTSGLTMSAGRLREEDDGDESDPEESETPWKCTIVLSRVGEGGTDAVSPASAAAAATAAADGTSSDHTRVRVATLSPIPSHPKVIVLLKLSFPLPDIIVDRLQVCQRTVSPDGIARPNWNLQNWGGDEPDGLVLTVEEIKDVVCSTGLWLIARENIGGVGKVNRR